MNNDNTRRDQNNTRRETPATPSNTLGRRAWKRPEFTEVSACAEICAYVFRG